MRYEPPGTHFIPWAPFQLKHKVDRAFYSEQRATRAEAAFQALDVLGSNAASAIPALAQLVAKTRVSNTSKARQAAKTMSYLGPEAVPPMLTVWSNCIPGDKRFLSIVIATQLFPDILTWPPPYNFHDFASKDQLPVLLYTMQVLGEPFRSAASNAVWRIAPESLANSPAK
jgi:hypothetical protein